MDTKQKHPYKYNKRTFIKLSKLIKQEIIATLRNEEPLTVSAIAVRTELTWQTAKRRLNELVADGAVVLREIEGAKLFFLNPEFKKEEREP